VGDAIYHCHLYPHFAQGMWALWRNHDVFEQGTELDANGRPAANSRALPDAEIAQGTPIPAVVPIPTLAMAPMPSLVRIVDGQVAQTGQRPGFPFFVPGVAGHRAPQPPLDFALDGAGEPIDGGLPRHVVTGGTASFPDPPNRLDFHKENDQLTITELPHEGTVVEQAAMEYHAQRTHDSMTPAGDALAFVTNGRPPTPGAPFADPCVNDTGGAAGSPRLYKGAAIELDLVFNKVGWHFPQARILALWDDIDALLNRSKPPEPLFFRANSNDCITFHHANLLPKQYELDDFQVTTPTDTLGQHIHLVKFDVMASDGSGNGWNYEDGTFSPGEVIERIDAIKNVACAGSTLLDGRTCGDLQARPHPVLRDLGAQTTVQRWYADPVTGGGGDRTLRTVFTHDHFAPSTHQQAGLSTGLVIEPQGSTWRHAETGAALGTRGDGGPTSWQAIIQPPDASKSYREFMIDLADFTLAYEAGGSGFPDPARAINPPGRIEIGLPDLVARPNPCPGGAAPPCPEAISADDPGTFTVNYRNEPLALRVFDPATGGQAQPTQQNPLRGDLAFAFRSDIQRAIPALNSQPGFYPPLTGDVRPGDPFTPLLRAYPNDNVVVRVLVGGQEEGHNFTIHGAKWLHEPSDPRSGWRNTQMMAVSEHFEFEIPLVPIEQTVPPFVDHFWTVDASADGLWNGAWGLMRVYDRRQDNLAMLPNNTRTGTFQNLIANRSAFQGACPASAPKRQYSVSALAAKDILPPVAAAGNARTLVYNSREGAFGDNRGPLHDPTALLYFRDTDLNIVTSGPPAQRGVFLRPGVPIEPLVLRARAGECIEVTLTNRLLTPPMDRAGYNLLPMMVAEPSFGLGGANRGFNFNDLDVSRQVGLSPQLVARDVSRDDGWNVGLNSLLAQTASPNQSRLFRWYAGHLQLQPNGNLVATPVEFGAVNLTAADPIKQTSKGLIGALVIEPPDATWVEDATSRASATVTAGGSSFREFVLVFQDDVNLRDRNDNPICPVAAGNPCGGPEDAEDSGNKAINYRTEPLWFRQGFAPGEVLEKTRNQDFTHVLSNSIAGGDPQTPVFIATPGQSVRFHVLQPAGHPRNGVFALHGHNWQRQPYLAGDVPAQRIGNNPVSEWTGAQEGHGPANHFTIVPNGGAGPAGDYLYRNQSSFPFDGGQWGIFRVQ
jgi:manganese oxidase